MLTKFAPQKKSVAFDKIRPSPEKVLAAGLLMTTAEEVIILSRALFALAILRLNSRAAYYFAFSLIQI